MNLDPTTPFIPVFFVAMLLENAVLAARGRGYERADARTSLLLGVGMAVTLTLFRVVEFSIYTAVSQHRLADLGSSPAIWALMPLLDDLAYYWFHRASHEVRALWAIHVNHHSSPAYHLATALRQPPLEPFVTWAFWAPLALLGVRPEQIILMKAISNVYQFFLHTELVGRLGPLEWVLNTPSHHRVHHGSNPQYLDRNYGGTTILWDRLFRTFAAEDAPVVYGITRPLTSSAPLHVWLHEWRDIARDLRQNPRRAAQILLGRPGDTLVSDK